MLVNSLLGDIAVGLFVAGASGASLPWGGLTCVDIGLFISTHLHGSGIICFPH